MNEELMFNYPEENLYILGFWFGYEREKRGYSLRGISRSTNITPTLISDIENQKVKANIETLIALFEALGISFVTDVNHLNAVSENITAFYHAIYESNQKLMKTLKDSLIPQLSVLNYSLLTIDLVLAEAMIDVEIKHQSPKDTFYALKNHLIYLNDYQTQKYHLIKGQYLLQQNKFNAAKEAFIKASKVPYQKRGFATAHDYLAYIESRSFNPYQAIEYAKVASKTHGKYSNLFRKISADFIMIKSYIEIYQYDKAESLIYNLSFVLVESNQQYYLEIQAFKAYLSYVKNNFQKAIDEILIMKAPNVFQVFLIIMSYAHLGQKEDALKYIYDYEKIYQNTNDQMAYYLIIITKTMFEKPNNADLAIHYLLDHVHEYQHIQVIRELIKLSSKYVYHEKSLETLYKIHELSMKITKISQKSI